MAAMLGEEGNSLTDSLNLAFSMLESGKDVSHDEMLELISPHGGTDARVEQLVDRGHLRPAIFREYSVMFGLLSEDGVVEADQLCDRLHMAPMKADEMIAAADQDGNGVLDFGEFIHFLLVDDDHSMFPLITWDEDWSPTDQELRRHRMLFDLIDTDCSGTLDTDELGSALHLDDVLEATIMDHLEAGDSNELGFEAFVNVMHGFEVQCDHDFLSLNRRKLSEEVSEADMLPPPTTAALDKAVADVFEALGGGASCKTLKLLVYTEDILHRGGRVPQGEDYDMRIDIQKQELVREHESITRDEFAAILEMYPTCVFLCPAGKKSKITSATDAKNGVEGADDECKVAFSKLDVDGSGGVSVGEVNTAMQSMLKKGLSASDMDSVFGLISRLEDLEGQEVTYPDFCEVMSATGGASVLATNL